MVPGPGLQMHNDGEIEADGERPNNCHAVRMAYALQPFPLSSPAYPKKLGHEGRRTTEVSGLSRARITWSGRTVVW